MAELRHLGKWPFRVEEVFSDPTDVDYPIGITQDEMVGWFYNTKEWSYVMSMSATKGGLSYSWDSTSSFLGRANEDTSGSFGLIGPPVDEKDICRPVIPAGIDETDRTSWIFATDVDAAYGPDITITSGSGPPLVTTTKGVVTLFFAEVTGSPNSTSVIHAKKFGAYYFPRLALAGDEWVSFDDTNGSHSATWSIDGKGPFPCYRKFNSSDLFNHPDVSGTLYVDPLHYWTFAP